MKNTSYQIVEVTFQKKGKACVFIESIEVGNQNSLDLEDLMVKLELKARSSAEKTSTNAVLEQYESDEVHWESLSLLTNGTLEQAVSEKYQYIKRLNLDQVTLLNNVTSIDDDQELISVQYTQDVVEYFKANKEDYPSLNVKALSSLRDIAVSFMLNGQGVENAFDQAYEEVMK